MAIAVRIIDGQGSGIGAKVSPKGNFVMPTGDFFLDVSMGRHPGIQAINKFGRNSAVVSGGTEEVWSGSATYVFPATALMTSISQTADQSTMRGGRVEVQGLDANWDAITQIVKLDATLTTNVVTLGTPLIRCYRMRVLEDVVTDSDIRVHNVGESQDYAVITAGLNQTQMAIYTVPRGITAFMTNWYATSNPGGGAPTTLDMNLWASDRFNLYAKQHKHSMGISGDVDAYGYFQHYFLPYKVFTQQTDIFVTVTTSGAGVDVSAGFDLFLVDNELIQ